MKYLLAVLLCAATQAHAQKSPEQEVAAAVEQLRQQLLNPDSNRLAQMVANQLSYGHSSGLIENKQAFLQALVGGRSDFLTIELSGQTIDLIGKTAIVRHRLEGDVVDNGNAASIKLHVLTVWQKQNGSWILIARQATKLPS